MTKFKSIQCDNPDCKNTSNKIRCENGLPKDWFGSYNPRTRSTMVFCSIECMEKVKCILYRRVDYVEREQNATRKHSFVDNVPNKKAEKKHKKE